MRDLIKICGLKHELHVNAAVEAGASHLGFVFYAKSPRNIDVFDAATLRASIPDRTKIVALVVNPSEAFLKQMMSELRPDAIQFHGEETPEELARIKDIWGDQSALWKAVGITNDSDLLTATRFHTVADKLLFDARPSGASDRPGGNGEVFDWMILKDYDGTTPWLLAGGLNPENVGDAIAACWAIPGFEGVDVSSGVERLPGEKDPVAIARFIEAAHGAFQKGDETCRT